MRTIKRKRLFKKKTLRGIKRKKLFMKRGGTIPSPFGKLNSENIAELPENNDDIGVIDQNTHFSANIIKVDNRIELSNFEENKSRKLGWMYGQYIGNFNIIVRDADRIGSIKSLYANKSSKVVDSLFIPPINDKIKISELYSPWKLRLYDIDVDSIDGNIDTTMKNILVNFYNSKLKHDNFNMIKYIIDNSEDGTGENGILIGDIDKRYEPGLIDRSLYVKDIGIDNGVFDKNWDSITGEGEDTGKLNAFRLKQQIFMMNTIDIFSEYNDYIIPFNINYYRGATGENKYIKFIDQYLKYFDSFKKSNRGLDVTGILSKHLESSLSRMLCNFTKVDSGTGNHIFQKFKSGIFSIKNNNIRTKKIEASENFDVDSQKIINIDLKQKYIDFEYEYYINSLLTPKILTNLLLYNMLITKMILLETNNGKLKSYKDQKSSDFLDAVGRGIERGGNIHFDELYLVNKTIDEQYNQQTHNSNGGPYNIAKTDDSDIQKWYADLKATRLSDGKNRFIKIDGGNPYLYQVEEGDQYTCIYILNSNLYSMILEGDQGVDIIKKEYLDKFLEIGEKRKVFFDYFEGVLGKQLGKDGKRNSSSKHNSMMYTITPRP